jgi:hypothetical protein
MRARVDGPQVTLDEFSAVMKGELSGRDPMEAVIAAFAVLSRSDGSDRNQNLITFGKLQAVCKDFDVSCRRPPTPASLEFSPVLPSSRIGVWSWSTSV